MYSLAYSSAFDFFLELMADWYPRLQFAGGPIYLVIPIAHKIGHKVIFYEVKIRRILKNP